MGKEVLWSSLDVCELLCIYTLAWSSENLMLARDRVLRWVFPWRASTNCIDMQAISIWYYHTLISRLYHSAIDMVNCSLIKQIFAYMCLKLYVAKQWFSKGLTFLTVHMHIQLRLLGMCINALQLEHRRIKSLILLYIPEIWELHPVWYGCWDSILSLLDHQTETQVN